MAKKSRKNNNARFSPRALFQMKQKEMELKLSSYSFCKNPYKSLDYSPFIYMDILKALNKQFCKKSRPIKIVECTITESSDYVNSADCMIFPVFVRGQMFALIENNDYNKATYGLKVDKKKYLSIVESLRSYFSSTDSNKRSGFADFIKTVDGVTEYKRFSHTSARIWEQRIKDFIQQRPSNI